MPVWLSWIVGGFGWLIKTFLNRTPVAVAEAKQLGAAEQQVQNLQKANADVEKAVQAADAVRATDAADPGKLRAPDDPDCRDCQVQ